MIDPYKMIVINLTASGLFLIGVLVYKFIYPKRRINLFILLIFISLLPVISIFRQGAYESGDFTIHIYRIMEFYRSISEGNLMPSWAGDLNAMYGYPLFIFNYTLPYYFVSLFHFLGFSFIWSLKLFLILNIILSAIFMFLLAKNIFKNELAAFTSSIFYLFAPYHLIDVHFKIVAGEILFFTILPLFFLFVRKLLIKNSFIYIAAASLSFSALIMSHLVIAIFTGVLVFFYVLFYSLKNKSKVLPLQLIPVLILSLLASSYQWLGPLLLSKYSFIQNITIGTVYFPTLKDLLFAPWRWGFLFQGPRGEISHFLGYIHIFIVILLIIFIFNKKILRRFYSNILFWIISFFILVYLILPYSKWLWELLPIIKITGSHRLLILTSFASSVLAGYFTLLVKKKWIIYIAITFAILSTILNWGHRRVIPEINDDILIANLWKSTSEGEGHFYANTRWVDIYKPWFSELPKNKLEILKGKGRIENLSRSSTKHQYLVEAQTQLSLQENTLYFPGWNAKINDVFVPIHPNSKGIISLTIPKGKYNLKLSYEDIPIYKTIKFISFGSFLLILLYIAYYIFSKNIYAKK